MPEKVNTLLLVDDELYIRQSFSDFFEDRLWNTLTAESGEAGLLILNDTPVDAAIVDIRMMGMTGNEFIKAASKLHSSTVFVICTGSPEYDIPVELLNMPNVSNELVRKPVFDFEYLEETVIQILKSYNGT